MKISLSGSDQEIATKYDVIVVGGGLGGLTAGAKLAKDGKRVLLLEQHSIPGGCATTFRRNDYIMEVGLHAIDGLDEQDPKRKVFEELGVFNQVQFIQTDEFYRIKNERLDIVIPSSVQEAINILIKKFPVEASGIRKFFKIICSLRKEIVKLPTERWKIIFLLPIFPFLYPHLTFYTFKTVGDFIDSVITDEDLKLALLANLFYYHDDPYSMSLIYFSAAQASYFKGGTYYIKGGSQKLSDYLANVIEENNGKLIFNHTVTKILTKGKKAVGVTYQNNNGKIYSSYAKAIIVNAAIPNIASLLDKKNGLLIKKRIKKLVKSCSLLSIYIGFKREIKELGSKNYSTFMLHENVKKINELNKNFTGSFSKRSFFFVDYSQIDSELAPKGKSFGVVCIADYSSTWEELSGDSYKKKKKEVAQLFFKRLERFLPGIMNEIECYEVGTPKTIHKYTLNPEGTVYGFAQLPGQAGIFRLPNKSPIKNMYFASAWANPGGGFTGAIMSGWFCANEVNRAW
ncbi:phytoene desaturase family protein [Candidatus Electrothrix sp.]|uniref:phytoene desaturase family protein n=1 Tax=Candidatus Electrothrix sp. TaxID=2170559 RepID=UPI0040567BF1